MGRQEGKRDVSGDADDCTVARVGQQPRQYHRSVWRFISLNKKVCMADEVARQRGQLDTRPEIFWGPSVYMSCNGRRQRGRVCRRGGSRPRVTKRGRQLKAVGCGGRWLCGVCYKPQRAQGCARQACCGQGRRSRWDRRSGDVVRSRPLLRPSCGRGGSLPMVSRRETGFETKGLAQKRYRQHADNGSLRLGGTPSPSSSQVKARLSWAVPSGRPAEHRQGDGGIEPWGSRAHTHTQEGAEADGQDPLVFGRQVIGQAITNIPRCHVVGRQDHQHCGTQSEEQWRCTT